MADLYNNIVSKMSMQVQETCDEFIFSVLDEFARNNHQIVVEKEELTKAIQLIKWSKEYGPSIIERWYTAVHNKTELDKAYRKGFKDGSDKEHERIVELLNKMKGR